MPVVAGLVSSKDLIARSIGIKKEQLLPRLSAAIEKPLPPKSAEKGECQEVVEKAVDRKNGYSKSRVFRLLCSRGLGDRERP